MDVKEAFKILKADSEAPASSRVPLKPVSDACDVIVAAGFCPNCSTISPSVHYPKGRMVELRAWQPGNYWLNAGRECPDCEEFYPCGEQPEFEHGGGPSDADPGL